MWHLGEARMKSDRSAGAPDHTFDPAKIERPAPILMPYYLIVSLLAGPAFVFPLIPLWFKYLTLRYRFDDEGISMAWGVVFRREIVLTYRRIQDIHVTRNIFQRWMGLATVEVQTASGNAKAEMSIDGILEADALRDFLYTKMRGARGVEDVTERSAPADDVLLLLRQIRDSMIRGGSERQSEAHGDASDGGGR
jgi:uncharacterized protein